MVFIQFDVTDFLDKRSVKGTVLSAALNTSAAVGRAFFLPGSSCPSTADMVYTLTGGAPTHPGTAESPVVAAWQPSAGSLCCGLERSPPETQRSSQKGREESVEVVWLLQW